MRDSLWLSRSQHRHRNCLHHGTHNIGYAARTIAYGDADVMLAGGSEMATTRTGIAAFSAARALSTRNDEPEKASRPWDRERDGFVLSDGAGVVVLEDLEHAKKRGATIYGEVVGFGMSDDAHHITAPPASGEGAARSMKNALRDAGLSRMRLITSTPMAPPPRLVTLPKWRR